MVLLWYLVGSLGGGDMVPLQLVMFRYHHQRVYPGFSLGTKRSVVRCGGQQSREMKLADAGVRVFTLPLPQCG